MLERLEQIAGWSVASNIGEGSTCYKLRFAIQVLSHVSCGGFFPPTSLGST